ncbi:MAG TPA: creatininase family protein [Terrimicrobiaceae bacterium]|nr:creatininase family protein [Terrimicrobiaceae bacterium]
MNSATTALLLNEQRPVLAILPLGATEQHSGHLPIGTDTLIGESVAREAARELDAFLMPALPYSISQMHRGHPGSFWVRNTTLRLVLHDLAESLIAGGFRQFLILNSHGGNVLLPSVIQDLNFDHPALHSFTINTYDGVMDREMFPDEEGLSHAGDYETSLMLHLHPDLVVSSAIRENPLPIAADALRYNTFAEISAHGHTGNPALATAEKGRQVFALMTARVVSESRRILRETGSRRGARSSAPHRQDPPADAAPR